MDCKHFKHKRYKDLMPKYQEPQKLDIGRCEKTGKYVSDIVCRDCDFKETK
jgi:hypothetical protein